MKKIKMKIFIHRFMIWIHAWIAIVCETINILTLTYYRPWWDFKFISWDSKRRLKIRKKETNE
jgi:hypothetical protein